MADTKRTLNDLLSDVFKDNQPTGSITPQDIRDLTVSVGPWPYGSLFTSSPIETVIGSQSTYVKILGTTTSNNLRDMDMPADNRLRSIALIPYHYHIACTVSFTAVGANRNFGLKMYVFDDSAGSGAVVDGSMAERTIGASGDKGSTALHWDVILDTNDYLELHVENQSDTSNFTASNIYMFAMGMPM